MSAERQLRGRIIRLLRTDVRKRMLAAASVEELKDLLGPIQGESR